MSKNKNISLDCQDLDWDNGTPSAPKFGDKYYSKVDGIAESKYVFLDGIEISDIDQDTDKAFAIGETGFGTGLNFLLTWKHWRQSNIERPLYFISTEGYPLTTAALKKAHENFSSLAHEAKELRDKWPAPSPGFHHISFDEGRVVLLLLFGAVKDRLTELNAEIDAWYLDGFAPSKNPDMWSEGLFKEIARLSAPNAKFATFTAAGAVRRNLVAVGFEVSKTAGFAGKRERLVGRYTEQNASPPPSRTWHEIPKNQQPPESIAIIGGGLAGSFLAKALRDKNIPSTIIASDNKARSSDVPSAILSPRFLLDYQASARFLTSAYIHAANRGELHLAQLQPSGLNQCSETDADKDRHKKLLDYLNWPDEWVSPREGGLHFPKSGAYETSIILRDLNKDQPRIHATIHDIKNINNEWHLFDINGNLIIKSKAVIYCGGMAGSNLPFIKDIPLVPNRGQIDLLPVEHCEGLAATTVTYGGYLTPANKIGAQSYRAVGASFTRQIKDNWQETSHIDTNKNIARLEAHFHLDEMTIPRDKTIAWVGLRATTIDHLPIVGPLPDRQQ